MHLDPDRSLSVFEPGEIVVDAMASEASADDSDTENTV